MDAYLFEPGKAPAAKEMVNRTRRPKLTTARAAVLGLMQNYLAGLMDVGVSLLEIHKLMYFLQVAGEPLKLNYKAGPYGPYAENLRHVLGNLESHYIHGYGEGGDDPRKPIELVDGAGCEGQAILQDYPETRERFGRVSQLIEGFESPFGMELLATVHWVADRQGAKTVEQAVEKVHGWNTGRRCSLLTRSRRRGTGFAGWVGSTDRPMLTKSFEPKLAERVDFTTQFLRMVDPPSRPRRWSYRSSSFRAFPFPPWTILLRASEKRAGRATGIEKAGWLFGRRTVPFP